MPRPPDLNQIKRILIVKLSSIGDVIHALPVSAALGDAFPHLQMTWIVEEAAAPLVRCNPYLADVVVFPDSRRRTLPPGWFGSFLRLRRDLAGRPVELALDLQGLTRSAVLAWASGAPWRFGWDYLRELAPFVLTRVPRQAGSIHVVDQLLDVARFLGAHPREVKFPLHVPDVEEARAVELLREVGIPPGLPFLALNPTGGRAHKGWGVDRLVGLLDDLARGGDLPVVLVGGPGDRDVGRDIQTRARKRPANLVGRTSLLQLAAVLRAAALHVAGDTGSIHLAAALGTPVVAVYGRSNPARLAPYGQAGWALHRRQYCATACYRRHQTAPLNSSQKCLAPPPACLAAVTVEEVAAAVRRRLSYGPGRQAAQLEAVQRP